MTRRGGGGGGGMGGGGVGVGDDAVRTGWGRERRGRRRGQVWGREVALRERGEGGRKAGEGMVRMDGGGRAVGAVGLRVGLNVARRWWQSSVRRVW